MIALDTTVVVAAFAVWHEGHAAAIATLARRSRFPAHVVVESFSVLTRLPPPRSEPARQLLTRDRRALPTDEAFGVRYELL